MYRINYRRIAGILEGKTFYINGSFTSPTKIKNGEKFYYSPIDADIEVTQVLLTGNY